MLKKNLFALIFLSIIIIGCSACVADSNVDTADANFTDETTQHADKYSEEEIISIIEINIDILASKIDFRTDEQEIMAAYPIERNAILDLGELALPYLENIAGKFDASNEGPESYRAVMAMALAYKIKPELYELRFESPDGKYALMASVESFTGMFLPFEGGQYYNVRIVDIESGAVVITADDDYADYYANIEVNWSDDSRYAAISEGHQRYGTRMALFNIQKNEFVALPYWEIRDEIIPGITPYIYHLKFKSFDVESEHISVGFTIWLNDAAGTSVYGEYTYDIGEKKIVNLTHNYNQ